jgi:hypothetical protein
MRLDFARAHAARVQGDDLLVEAGETALVLGNQLRVEATVPIARDGQLELAAVG